MCFIYMRHKNVFVLFCFVLSRKAAYTFGGGAFRGSTGMDDGGSGGGGDAVASSASTGTPAEAWAPTAEQDHNLQLLELVVKLREALLSIPVIITPQETRVEAARQVAGGGGWAKARAGTGGREGGLTFQAVVVLSHFFYVADQSVGVMCGSTLLSFGAW